MPRCHIALGGNLGSVDEAFQEALRRLREAGCNVLAVSRNYRTAPVGEEGGEFLNAASTIETEIPPLELLDLLQSIEADLGRIRLGHWSPRTIDLDLLFYADEVIESPRLTVPHPYCWFRRFVLDPLSEIAPDFMHPVKRATVGRLRERLLERPFTVAFAGSAAEAVAELLATSPAEFPQATFSRWSTKESSAIPPPAEPGFIFWFETAGSGPTDPDGACIRFADLPPLPRIAVPATENSPREFVRSVMQSALGDCRLDEVSGGTTHA